MVKIKSAPLCLGVPGLVCGSPSWPQAWQHAGGHSGGEGTGGGGELHLDQQVTGSGLKHWAWLEHI